MKRLKLSTYSGLVVLVALLLGCSTPEENAGSSNTNASAQANSNTAPQIAQSNAPNGPTAVQPAPSLPSAESSPPANANAGAAPPAPVNPRAPKLLVSDKKLDFGKQPQDKSLVRAIVVRNGGHEELKIESVVPSWGCTTVDFPKVLRPGQAGSIKVKVETGKSPGPHTKSVTIKSNDPADPSHVVQFSFDVKG